jgi:hypothetical protein
MIFRGQFINLGGRNDWQFINLIGYPSMLIHQTQDFDWLLLKQMHLIG